MLSNTMYLSFAENHLWSPLLMDGLQLRSLVVSLLGHNHVSKQLNNYIQGKPRLLAFSDDPSTTSKCYCIFISKVPKFVAMGVTYVHCTVLVG